nr:hypothetical protein [Tanacetum cinerariifolium]
MVYIMFQTIFKRISLEQLAIFHEEQEDMRLQDPLKDLRLLLAFVVVDLHVIIDEILRFESRDSHSSFLCCDIWTDDSNELTRSTRVILPNKEVTETHHTEETKSTADVTQSLGASKSAKDQVNQLKIVDAKKEGTAKNLNASADLPAQSDPFGHLHEELRILNTKVDQLESSISKKVTNTLPTNFLGLLSEDLKNSLPQMLKDSIKQSVLESIVEKLPLFDAQVQQTLQDQLPSIHLKPMNKEFNAFNALESHRRFSSQIPSFKSFVILEGKLTNEDVMALVKEMKRLADLKAEKEKSEKSLQKIMNPATIRAQAQKMAENLIPPPCIKGSRGRVIREPKSRIFYYNGNFDLVFQREEEFHLATTVELIRLHGAIQRGTLEVEEMFKKMKLKIEARDDVIKARKIIQDNLDGLGQHMVRGGNNQTILLSFEEEQAELKLFSKLGLGEKLNKALRRDKRIAIVPSEEQAHVPMIEVKIEENISKTEDVGERVFFPV